MNLPLIKQQFLKTDSNMLKLILTKYDKQSASINKINLIKMEIKVKWIVDVTSGYEKLNCKDLNIENEECWLLLSVEERAKRVQNAVDRLPKKVLRIADKYIRY